jgi:hypothetical protein
MTDDNNKHTYIYNEPPNDPNADRRALLRALMNGTALSTVLYSTIAGGIAVVRNPGLVADPTNSDMLEDTRTSWWFRIPATLALGSGIASALLARAYMKAGNEINRRPPDNHDDHPPHNGNTPAGPRAPDKNRQQRTPRGPNRAPK